MACGARCELNGWITAQGTFPQIVELIDAVAAEPWAKRIDQIKIDPKDNGERFGISIRLSTLFIPGRASTTWSVFR